MSVPSVAPARFAAIDFETADYQADSACSLAVVVVENGVVIAEQQALIRPPRREIIFSYLHGITWADVAAAPDFAAVWAQMRLLLEGVEFIAAHNAAFDRKVMEACCRRAGIPPPTQEYLCTVKLARRLWGIYPTKLSHVCQRFNIDLRHHDAGSDARACARIVINACHIGGIPRAALLAKPSGTALRR